MVGTVVVERRSKPFLTAALAEDRYQYVRLTRQGKPVFADVRTDG